MVRKDWTTVCQVSPGCASCSELVLCVATIGMQRGSRESAVPPAGLHFRGTLDTMAQMIYLDHNATTPVLPEVLDAMMPYLTAEWGNPSSAYKFGSKLKSVIATAREQVAKLIGAHPMDVIFTSCAAFFRGPVSTHRS